MMEELSFLDAMAQAELVRKGEVGPAELVQAAVERVERLNPRLNAVITPLFEKALAQACAPGLAAGPFRGVPFLLKDLGCHSAGDPYYEGTRFLRELGWVAQDDTYLARKLKEGGFIFIGKTNTPELGTLPTTEPEAFGPTRNPWDPSRSSGGSSGGSAAAVASGMVPVAHGNDGGGSIRMPASECGIVGLKPSRGRVSWGPDYGDNWQGLAVEFVLSRSMRDTASILDLVSGPMPGDPYYAPPPLRPFRTEVGAEPGRLRIGFMIRAPGGVVPIHADCVTAVQDVARLLESLGHGVEESHPAALDEAEQSMAHIWTLVAASVAGSLDEWSRKTGRAIGPADLEPYNWMVAEMGRSVSAVQLTSGVQWLQGHTRRVAAWWADGFDLLLTPTLAEPPPALGQFKSSAAEPQKVVERVQSILPFTPSFNETGQPAISLPLFWNQGGLPIGVQMVAAYGREDLLIRVASQLEQARPWVGRRPPIHA
ncbi:MAG: amidase family protein [bacterium]